MSDRLRIALVVHDYHRHGGHGRYVVELASRYRRDHDVHVFANLVEEEDTTGITFHHIPAWRPNHLAYVLSFVIPATAKVRGAFDVIHSQGLCGLHHDLATAHFCQTAWYTSLEREGVSLTWRQHVFRSLVTPLERRALCQPGTRRVIAVSDGMRRNLADLYGRSHGVDVVYHGTDVDKFHPENRSRYRKAVRESVGVSDDRFLAIYVGDLKKGAVTAVRAVARTPGVTLLIVSPSPPDRYRAEAERAGVADRVIFHPHSKRVERFFAAADAFVFPTVYDPFGLVITEAMASGLPVLTSPAAGAAELLTHGFDGLVTDRAWDVDAIARHLARLRDDPGLRDRMGAAARARVEPLTWDRTAEQTLAVYRAVAAERDRRRG